MSGATGRRGAAAAASLTLTVSLVLGVATAASAASPTPSPSASTAAKATSGSTAKATSKAGPSTATPSPTGSPTAAPTKRPPAVPFPTLEELHAAQRNERAKAAEVARIGEQVIALQHRADDAGRASQVADERYLRAKQAATDAATEAETARTRAAVAAATAHTSRTRASALAAHLARTDLGTLPLALVLNSRTSGGTLQGLSTVAELSSGAARVYRQAVIDEGRARSAEAAARQALRAARTATTVAARAAAVAKRVADVTMTAVRAEQRQEQTLVADLAILRSTSEKVACNYLAGRQHRPACDARAIARIAHTPGAKVVAFARAHIGQPYVFAAAGPRAWDCSGLTMAAYAAIGIFIGPHSATAQYDLEQAEGHLVPISQAQPGDLLYYTDGHGDMFHTTIYSGSGMMIEAPYAGADVREVPVRTDRLVGFAARPAR